MATRGEPEWDSLSEDLLTGVAEAAEEESGWDPLSESHFCRDESVYDHWTVSDEPYVISIGLHTDVAGERHPSRILDFGLSRSGGGPSIADLERAAHVPLSPWHSPFIIARLHEPNDITKLEARTDLERERLRVRRASGTKVEGREVKPRAFKMETSYVAFFMGETLDIPIKPLSALLPVSGPSKENPFLEKVNMHLKRGIRATLKGLLRQQPASLTSSGRRDYRRRSVTQSSESGHLRTNTGELSPATAMFRDLFAFLSRPSRTQRQLAAITDRLDKLEGMEARLGHKIDRIISRLDQFQ